MLRLAPHVARGRMIVAHLGNGASMCALRDGRSIESTMGFTALDGLPMGTRCGQIDPGVLLYLAGPLGMSADAMTDLLYKQSGLLGLSGMSSDMRDLLFSREPAAAQAIEYFVYRALLAVGTLAAALEGVDGLVFTAGIGEHAVLIREQICNRLGWLGLQLDPAANQAGGPCITGPSSPVSAWVVPTDEERMIAIHVMELLGGGGFNP
jgi:acetate kinase